MSSAHLREFEAIIRAHCVADAKPHFARLSAHLRETLKERDFSSIGFVKEAVRIIAGLRGEAFSKFRFDSLSQAIPYLYAHGSLCEALVAARAMRTASDLTGSKHSVRQAENYLGIIHEGLGNVAQAVIHYHDALLLARSVEDKRGEIAVLINLGGALSNGGLYHEAIPCLLNAKALLTPLIDEYREYEPKILGNLAGALSHIGDSSGAYKAMSGCMAIAPEPKELHETYAYTNRQLTFIQIALDAGRLADARACADACEKYVSLAGVGPASFNARLADGLVNVYAGNVDYGLQQLESARDRAGVVEHSYQRVDALAMLIKAYEYCHRPHEALTALRQLLSYVSAQRADAVSALVSLERAESEIVDASRDFQMWRFREAELRAASAEIAATTSVLDLLERLAVTANLREDPSGQHGYRVGKLSALLARRLGWNAQDCFMLEAAARLHDIGKVAVPDNILLSSQDLKDEQRRFLRDHTSIGGELLSRSHWPHLGGAEQIARFHHEWWNGAGYPTGLSGTRIPVHARIVALADVFDALTHGRPYASAWSIQDALQQIKRLTGTQFDPELAFNFVALIDNLMQQHRDLDKHLEKLGSASPFVQARQSLRRMLSAAPI